MLKKLSVIVVIALIFASCGNNAEEQEEVKVLTVAQFNEQAENLVDSIVSVEGTVEHVCQHGGKRLRMFGEDPEVILDVEAGEEINMFEAEIEGSDVIIEGVVAEFRIDNAYLDEWEAKEKAKLAEDTTIVADAETTEEIEAVEEEHEHETEAVEEEHEELNVNEHHVSDVFGQIEKYRKQIAENEKDYLSFYSITCTKVTVKEIEVMTK